MQGNELTLERLQGRVAEMEQQLSVADDAQAKLKVGSALLGHLLWEVWLGLAYLQVLLYEFYGFKPNFRGSLR